MFGGFVKGMVIGGIVGASLSMMINSDAVTDPKTRRRMMRSGMNFMRRIGIAR